MTEPMTDARLDALLAQHNDVAAQLRAMHDEPVSARWRLIQGDSENLDCIGPVCPHQGRHPAPDGESDGDTLGQYDCCPYPVIECHTELIAAWIVELLNTAPALIQAIKDARKPKPPTMADAFELFRSQILAEEQPDE